MIAKSDLGRLEFIAKGAVGSVYRVHDYRVPGLAYKEVRAADPQEFTPEKRMQALTSMRRAVDFRARLAAVDRHDLDKYTTWPIDMVEEAGEPRGVVMPLIPPDFFTRIRTTSGSRRDLVFDLSWLSAKESQARANGIDRSGFTDVATRLALLAQLVYAVGRLHRHGAVYGDLSLKNVALAVRPPRVKLLDCDAAAALADRSRVQLHSPFFEPPENASGAQKLQDELTDIYKLGICIIRGLGQGAGVSQTRDPSSLIGVLDAAGVEVVTRAVGSARSDRPTVGELFDCLERNLLVKASPPMLKGAWLNREAVLRGAAVEVIWDCDGGRQIEISGPGGSRVVLADPGTGRASHVLTPAASGEIYVEVRNGNGRVRLMAGRVQLFDLPSCHVDLRGIAQPVVPKMPAVPLLPARALPPVPAMSTDQHPIPRITTPALAQLSAAAAVMRELSCSLMTLATSTRDGPGTPAQLGPPDHGLALAGLAADAAGRLNDRLDQVFRMLHGEIADGFDRFRKTTR